MCAALHTQSVCNGNVERTAAVASEMQSWRKDAVMPPHGRETDLLHDASVCVCECVSVCDRLGEMVCVCVWLVYVLST